MDTLPEIVSKAEPSFDIFDPSNIHTYTDLWTQCHKYLRSLDDLEGNGLSVTESKDNVDKFSIVNPHGIVKDELNKKQVCILMLLARYRNLLTLITKKNSNNLLTHDFFHEVESTREYHARQLLALCSSDDDILDDVKRFSIGKLEPLDISIYRMNRDSKLDSYDKVWLVNALMISMARWEIETFGSELYKEDYINDIVGENVSQLPSHLRILSRVIEHKKEDILQHYPKSVLMNYSHFYPLELYHTGKEPLNLRKSINAK